MHTKQLGTIYAMQIIDELQHIVVLIAKAVQAVKLAETSSPVETRIKNMTRQPRAKCARRGVKHAERRRTIDDMKRNDGTVSRSADKNAGTENRIVAPARGDHDEVEPPAKCRAGTGTQSVRDELLLYNRFPCVRTFYLKSAVGELSARP